MLKSKSRNYKPTTTTIIKTTTKIVFISISYLDIRLISLSL